MRTRFGAAVGALLAACCGCGGHGSPKPVSGPAKEAAAVVAELGRATATRDFKTICDRLLAAAERREAGGRDCVHLMGARARGIHTPRIRIQAIELGKDASQALVKVRTTARGQAPVDDVIRLVRESGRFRIASLGR